MFKKLYSMLAFAAMTVFAMAQDVNVSGTITDINGSAIPGALVIEKGTTNAVKTKTDGTYSITIPAKRIPTTIIVRSIGAGTSEFDIDGSLSSVTFNSALGSNSRNLDEVVISASKKSEKILNAPASVSVINETKIQQNSSLSVVDNVKKVAAVDVIPTGIVSNNVVMRGFNNIFSGASMFMVDNRLASVPSLRVNAFQLIPTSNVDVRSMEIVRGPASALYGPFAANGVLAVYTKSPLDMENRMEVTLGLTSGLRSGDDDNAKYFFKANNTVENLGILNPEIRIAGKLTKTLGIKVSGNYLSASDYAFFDAREPNHVNANFGNLSAGKPWASDGTPADTFNRDFKIKKVAVESKLEWRPAVNTELSFASGYSSNTNMELTGLGAAQAKDWVSTFYQFQAKKDKFWFQAFLNETNSGNTYLIPQVATQSQFTYLKENSKLYGIQAQHSSKYLENKLSLVYGTDLFMTRPSGNVYGRFDNKANVNQFGGYLQGEYKFNKKWSATAASRIDYQDAIDEWMFSPRAAIVYKPKENHTLRVTYNRAFSSPTALNFYLDLNNAVINNGTAAVRGFGNSKGFEYNYGSNGAPRYLNVSGSWNDLTQANVAQDAYNSLQTTLTGILTQSYIQAGFNPKAAATAAASAAASSTAGILNNVGSKTAPLVVDFNVFNTEYSSQLNSGVSSSVAYASALNKAKIDPSLIKKKEEVRSTVTQTWETGYKGLVSDKLSLGIDLYYTRIENFSSPLTSASYQVMAGVGSAAQAQLATNVAALSANQNLSLLFKELDKIANGGNGNGSAVDELIGLYSSPRYSAGTVAPLNSGTGTDIILTYLNLGTVDVAGLDVSFNYAISKLWNLEGAFSATNKDKVYLEGSGPLGYVSLNAPKFKSALNLEYKLPIDNNGMTARLGWRWMDAFDANSGVYSGRVNAVNMLDLGLSWRPSNSKNTVLALNVNNLLDYRHQYFPTSSAMGRIALFKILHTFGVK
jgi:outer membrane receptor for ferrienterochelin and colicins